MGEPVASEELLDDAIRDELKRFFLKVVREADKEYRQSVPCEKCPGFKHQVNFQVPDIAARIQAAEKLLDRLEGKAAPQKPAEPAPKFDASKMDDLTDAQLEAILASGQGVSVAG